MSVSLFDLFKSGIGPSSSHTVGPMVAACRFVTEIDGAGELESIERITVELYGSLALTGMGHGTDKAILLGLTGEQPDSVEPQVANEIKEKINARKRIYLLGKQAIPFELDKDLKWHRHQRLPYHPNGMQFTAHTSGSYSSRVQTYYSVGGGFVLDQEEMETGKHHDAGKEVSIMLPYPFHSAAELLEIGQNTSKRISDIILANESTHRSEKEIYTGIDRIWQTMQLCIDRGCQASGLLPGQLKVERRAGKLYERLTQNHNLPPSDPMQAMDWVNLWAIAVNEENAAGGRVVTAPTNGAAGIIPAVIKYYDRFCSHTGESSQSGIYEFFLTATAIGALYKKNASISGAEVGCQGEIGVACSMAAGGLTAALGGTNEQVESAAEIGMEHNLGLTCDPIGGLVQIPCIERNAMGVVKAINASRIAMAGDGCHKVSLDKVIDTMRQTGADMQDKYKETSKGGLAINVVEC